MLPLVLIAAAMSLGVQLEVDATSSCEDARMKCVYRVGCSTALRNYMLDCSSVLHAEPPVTHCPEACQLALITLTSTDEGKQLMNCDCKDEFCTNSKARLEVCRPYVERAHNETVVSCVVAQGICAADTQCYTALEYYHRLCRSMFDGRKCSYRCKNSISILRRQQKAAKLDTCWCDGREDYDCPRIRTNMAKLCFHKEPETPPMPPLPGDVDSNELHPSAVAGSSSIFPAFTLLVITLLACRTLAT
ncbi:growth arrest-specific protein 1-like [Lycorma delicatula]|uniref:growth arrest-specific protein 1-like n=1 Tax=Lycorma delicatula TaxID=130591 RepID=UPI003F515403